MDSTEWKTAITKVEPNKIQLRGYRIEDLMGKFSFGDVVYLVFTGRLPDARISKLMNAILISSVDHGVTPPSVLAALTSTSTGAPFNVALATGILSINQYHGGAIEDCMEILTEATGLCDQVGDPMKAAEMLVRQVRERKRRIGGFGHRIHTIDPRATKLLDLAKEAEVYGQTIKMALEIEKALYKITGKNLPLNIDGAIAAVLLELQIPKELGNMFFIIARVPGLIAHIFEEKTRQKPMRKIIPGTAEYDGEQNLKL